jgi:tetratricopeptide (TPR) repeat protein
MCSLFMSINRKDDALLFIEESLKITPNNEAALLHKGYILEKMDKLERSNRCYDIILKINKFNKFAYNNKAHNFRRNGNLEDALIFVNEALKIDQNFINSINNKISILRELGKDNEALEFLNPILEKHSDSRTLILAKVNLLIDQLDLRNAMQINNILIEKDQNDLDAINNKGVIFEHNAKFQSPEKFVPLAMECFQMAIDKDKDYALGWSNKIVCLINSNQIEDAEKIMNFIFNIFQLNSYILREKGHIFMNKGDPKKALRFFDKSIKIMSSRDVLIDKCYALFELNKYKEVIQIADNNLLNHDSRDSDAWHLKGIALKKLHQNSRAELCFEKEKEFKKIPKSLLE